MNSIETLATFFGWCTVINFGILLIGGLSWILVKEGIGELVATIFGVTKEDVKATFLRILLQYRSAIVILNLVPYITLKIMA
jgi:hypothetical protein